MAELVKSGGIDLQKSSYFSLHNNRIYLFILILIM